MTIVAVVTIPNDSEVELCRFWLEAHNRYGSLNRSRASLRRDQAPLAPTQKNTFSPLRPLRCTLYG
jgi:hypothetical protein